MVVENSRVGMVMARETAHTIEKAGDEAERGRGWGLLFIPMVKLVSGVEGTTGAGTSGGGGCCGCWKWWRRGAVGKVRTGWVES
jgi:hypothetical protein